MSYYPLTQQLENRIKAVNDVHALLLTYGTRISKVFSDYFQLKVINQNGTFVKAVQHDLDPILNQLRDVLEKNFGGRCSVRDSHGSIWFEIKVSYSTSDETCNYFEEMLLIGSCFNGLILTEVFEPNWKLKTDYNYNDVVAKRIEIKQTEDKLSRLKTELGPFPLL